MLLVATNGEKQRVEPILARLQASLEILPRPISPVRVDARECGNSSTGVLDKNEIVTCIENSRDATNRSREEIFSEEEYAFFSQVL